MISGSETETFELGRSLGVWLGGSSNTVGSASTPATVVLLEGGMGVGKTVLVRGLAAGLGLSSQQVQSPTYTLVNEYSDGNGAVRLVHCDLYRLRPEEVEATGVVDLVFGEVLPVVVEWSQRLPIEVPSAVTLRLSRLDAEGTDDCRRIERVRVPGD